MLQQLRYNKAVFRFYLSLTNHLCLKTECTEAGLNYLSE